MVDPDTRRKKEIRTLIVVFLGVLLLSALVAYFLTGPRVQREPQQATSPQAETPPGGAVPERRPSPAGSPADNVMEDIFGAQPAQPQVERGSWGEIVAGLTLRLSLAALLAAG